MESSRVQSEYVAPENKQSTYNYQAMRKLKNGPSWREVTEFEIVHGFGFGVKPQVSEHLRFT